MDRSPPVGLAMVLCESVERGTDGTRSLFRLVDRVVAKQYPFTLPQLTVYLALTETQPGATYEIAVVESVTENVLVTLQVSLPQGPEVTNSSVVEVDLSLKPFPIEFSGPGIFIVRFLADDEVIIQRTLEVTSEVAKPSTSATTPGLPGREDRMVELALLESIKETDNKLCWSTKVDGTEFRLYIPKWRVPEPWPKRIAARVEAMTAALMQTIGMQVLAGAAGPLSLITPEAVAANVACRTSPICTVVEFVDHKSRTIRYCPLGDQKSWELGQPYIPTELTYGGQALLLITVNWDLQSRGRFAG